MPFGRPGHGEFGTYFIGYSRTPRTTETMLQNMFVGSPPGNHDRLLDFSRAVTGALFFVPSTSFLDNIGEENPSPAETEAFPESAEPAAPPAPDTSLKIGSLKGEKDE
jgi:putative iron-dependent peroxidase